MTGSDSPRFGTIFFTIEDGGIVFEVEDARVEITRDVSAMGRRTGASLNIRVHIILDLNTGSGINDAAIRLFNISTQADDIVQRFQVEWRNPVSGDSGGDTRARQLSFSGWCCGYELYRPETTGASDFGTSDATSGTRLGRADQLLHCAFAVVTDDDNIGNLTLTT
ncbi:MAG: hypothetical protein JJD97_08320 [Gemmatimonadaceae bacterium]|nr:hypothetical protein [Gemmatimonadaceae bacterium]